MEVLDGKIIGKCKIIGKLDAGGMATIYRGQQTDLNREVAIKILPQHLAEQEGFSQRFQREAQAVANLEHPHILAIYDYGQQDGLTYIVMPLIKGGTLKERLKKSTLTFAEIDSFLQQMCDALGYAHEHSIVHRDVKPANMLLTGRRNDWLLLADFGIAKALESTEHLTNAGVGVGTPEYMAPEQLRGGDVGPYSDIYALGVVLFQLLTGRLPFAGNQYEVWMKHMQAPVPRASEFNPQVSPAMQAVIEKAMAKEPKDRFKNTEELSTAFHEAVQDVIGTQAIRVPIKPEGGPSGSWIGPGTPSGSQGPGTPLPGNTEQEGATRFGSTSAGANVGGNSTPALPPTAQTVFAGRSGPGVDPASNRPTIIPPVGSATAPPSWPRPDTRVKPSKPPWLPLGLGALVLLIIGGSVLGFTLLRPQPLPNPTPTAQTGGNTTQVTPAHSPTPAASPTPSESAVPVPTGQQLVSDPLSSDKGTFDLSKLSPVPVFKDGQMVVDGGEGVEVLIRQPLPSADVITKVTAKEVDKNGTFGIVFHAKQDASAGYFFGVYGKGTYTLYQLKAGDNALRTVIPPTHSDAINQGIGATNTITVVTRGAHYDFYVNGQKVTGFEGSADPANKVVGVFVSAHFSVAFSKFDTYALPS